ncbi:MAG: ubiF 2 [Myxococcales bacterium]|nr:ubiF 2 [Myxococcales bacterium]
MVLGWLLARAGVDVIVLEKHADFFRDFRGDTIHPSTLELMYELGVLEEFLRLPHTRLDHLDLDILGQRVPGPDFSKVPTHSKFVAMMPQWDFLDFVKQQAGRYPSFRLIMEASVTELSRNGERITGVIAKTPNETLEIRADLVVGADGRHSVVRDRAGLSRKDFGAPIDVLWMRIPRLQTDGEQVLGIMGRDKFVVMLNRGAYWQCAYLIPKGGLDALKQRGLPAFCEDLRSLAPFLGDRVGRLASWDDLKLLTVVVDRLDRWWSTGLLCIGDAAHAMSPIGGVGINLAIQDAVAAANRLAKPLMDGTLMTKDLAAVQARREPAARKIQGLQIMIHDHVIAKILAGRGERVLRTVRFVLEHVPALRHYMARTLGVGRMEHVKNAKPAPPVHAPAQAPSSTAERPHA